MDQYYPLTSVYLGDEAPDDFPLSQFQEDVGARWLSLCYDYGERSFIVVVPVEPQAVAAVQNKYPLIQRIKDNKIRIG